MLQVTKLFKCIAISVFVAASSACVFAPGMRVGDLPPSGTKITTDTGLTVQVETLSANNLPVITVSDSLSDVLPLLTQKSYPTYLLAPSDVLGITMWANPEIAPPLAVSGASAGYVIDQNGFISFPLIGEIKAKGESLETFSSQLRKRLAVYLKYPDVQVKVLAYSGRKYFIDGEVKAPGQYAMSDQVQSLESALASAGGALETGDINNILFTRNGRNYHIRMLDMRLHHLSPSGLLLQQGDNIHVYAKENRKIYILGEAGVPSILLIPEQGFSLMSVIGEGRGLNSFSSNPAKIYVVRDDVTQGLTKIYHLDLSSITNIALAERFKMEPNDIVYVDAAGLARWNRVLSLLLPSASAVQTARIAVSP
jgi:polysaccharide export outer membrane protein